MLNPTRLSVARQRKGLTKKELADLIGVEPRAITGYEAGEYQCTDKNLRDLSRHLGFSVGFLTADDIEVPSADIVSFRSLKKLTARRRDMALAAASFAYTLSDWVDAHFTLPGIDLLDLRNEDPSSAALALRQHWGLGLKPIGNMVHLLESKGVRVFRLAEDTQDIDAYSLWKGERAYVFLNTNKSSERSRFDAAHELGHLVLHMHIGPSGQDAEREADQFASAFLMPKDPMLANGRINSLSTCFRIKKTWGVSIAAAVYRAFSLGMMTKWTYETLFKEISRRGWRRQEPEPLRPETSLVWRKVFDQLRDDDVSVEQLADELNLPYQELFDLMFGLVPLRTPGGGVPSGGPGRGQLRVVK